VPEEKETRGASRYETFIAIFIALLAVCVAGYTAYMQRQQVRAQVWPILEFESSNGPDIHFTLSNKGVGPAIIRHVIVKVDDQPVKNWNEVLDKFLGPVKHRYSESDMGGRVFAPNELITVFTPCDVEGNSNRQIQPALGGNEQGSGTPVRRDLLLLHARRMLDPACRRFNCRHDDQNPSLSDPIGDYLRAVATKNKREETR